ncbi:MAG: hypothetical protein ACREFG_08400 [Chthoniobacterales bacterium]
MTQMSADWKKEKIAQNYLRRSASSADPLAATAPREMEVQVQIEELVLHGFDLNNRHAISEEVERELVRLLSEEGVPLSLRSENARDEVKAPSLNAPLSAKPPAIGRQIAQAVYKGFGQ